MNSISSLSETQGCATMVQIKWNHHGVYRRFAIDLRNGYAGLLGRIVAAVPEFQEKLAWRDEEGAMIHLSTEDEFLHAFSLPENQKLLRLFTVESPAKAERLPGLANTKESLMKELYGLFTCNICLKEGAEIRFKCKMCPNFYLCEGCERKDAHPGHAKICILTPRPRGYLNLYPANTAMLNEHHFPCHRSLLEEKHFVNNGPQQKFNAIDATVQALQDALKSAANAAGKLAAFATNLNEMRGTVDTEIRKIDTLVREQLQMFKGLDLGEDTSEREAAASKVVRVEIKRAEKEMEKSKDDELAANRTFEKIARVTVKRVNANDSSSSESDFMVLDADKQDTESAKKNADSMSKEEMAKILSKHLFGEDKTSPPVLAQTNPDFVFVENTNSDDQAGMRAQNVQNINPYTYLPQAPEECRAGTPYLQPPAGPHNPHCIFIHPDPTVASCVERIERMGFDNCNGWITQLATAFCGDIAQVVEAMKDDPIHAKRILMNALN